MGTTNRPANLIEYIWPCGHHENVTVQQAPGIAFVRGQFPLPVAKPPEDFTEEERTGVPGRRKCCRCWATCSLFKPFDACEECDHPFAGCSACMIVDSSGSREIATVERRPVGEFDQTPEFWRCNTCEHVNAFDGEGPFNGFLAPKISDYREDMPCGKCGEPFLEESWVISPYWVYLGTWNGRVVAEGGPWYWSLEWHRDCAGANHTRDDCYASRKNGRRRRENPCIDKTFAPEPEKKKGLVVPLLVVDTHHDPSLLPPSAGLTPFPEAHAYGGAGHAAPEFQPEPFLHPDNQTVGTGAFTIGDYGEEDEKDLDVGQGVRGLAVPDDDQEPDLGSYYNPPTAYDDGPLPREDQEFRDGGDAFDVDPDGESPLDADPGDEYGDIVIDHDAGDQNPYLDADPAGEMLDGERGGFEDLDEEVKFERGMDGEGEETVGEEQGEGEGADFLEEEPFEVGNEEPEGEFLEDGERGLDDEALALGEEEEDLAEEALDAGQKFAEEEPLEAQAEPFDEEFPGGEEGERGLAGEEPEFAEEAVPEEVVTEEGEFDPEMGEEMPGDGERGLGDESAPGVEEILSEGEEEFPAQGEGEFLPEDGEFLPEDGDVPLEDSQFAEGEFSPGGEDEFLPEDENAFPADGAEFADGELIDGDNGLAGEELAEGEMLGEGQDFAEGEPLDGGFGEGEPFDGTGEFADGEVFPDGDPQPVDGEFADGEFLPQAGEGEFAEGGFPDEAYGDNQFPAEGDRGFGEDFGQQPTNGDFVDDAGGGYMDGGEYGNNGRLIPRALVDLTGDERLDNRGQGSSPDNPIDLTL
ncbi:hypothetical protein N658DRAFT_81368 [Parathielavia hyrcaniae]|uniref:Uncharacterized protein n=1 Tax=Parathielavia hyrcaniae TaxID=113614 RepID=A0AAN6PQH3_9PEZI|nr:hypothetical protein N658DRAFT_81368 [Parathielavia hyrcaniae]